MITTEQIEQAVKWAGWWMFNTSWDDFAEIMRAHGIVHEDGIQKQWDAMHLNPMRWWLELDCTLQSKVAAAALGRYQN